MYHLLLVEDAEDCQILVRETLVRIATVRIAASIRDARRALADDKFDLIVLDLTLPDGDGMEFFRELQKQGGLAAPVCFLTARAETGSQVTAFALGADDYILKPLRPLEFRARVEAKLKKRQENLQSPLSLIRGELSIELGIQQVYVTQGAKRRVIDLTGREFKILYQLARHEGGFLSRNQLITAVWGTAVHILDRTVDTHIYTLRKKLGVHAQYIESELGIGYRFNSAKKLKRAAA